MLVRIATEYIPLQIAMEGKQEIDALFLYAAEGILVVNEEGEIIRINPSAEKMFGYDKDELLGKPIEVLVPARLSQIHKKHRANYNEYPQSRHMGAGMELHGLRKDGSEFPAEISLSPYWVGDALFVIAFIVDITIRKRTEEKLKNYSAELENQVKKRTLILQEAIDELEKTKAELNQALAKERKLNELKSRFVSMASHEFRTPLATILSSVTLMAKYSETGDTEKQKKHISKIKSAIANLTDILNDFLSVSKLEEGKVESLPEEFDLEEFISSVIKEMEPLAKTGQRIAYKHKGNTTITLDKKMLKNILFNLISNAIKFSDEGKQIEIVSLRSKTNLTISVKDQGMGIPKEDQAHLFERFFRGHNVSHIQGTGLGLNIVMKYAELMKGSINFTSQENKGTTFTLKFAQ